MKRIHCVILASGVAISATSAYASGFMVRENSAEGLAMAFAGGASRADEAATVFNNPAGMAFLTGTQTEIGGVAVFPSIHFEGNATIGPLPGGTPIPGDNSRNGGQFAFIPHAYAKIDINNRWQAGIAFTVPFGNTVDYSEAWSGRYVNIKTAALTFDINPNVSFKVTDHLAIAAGFSAQYLKLDLSSRIPQFLIFSSPGMPDGGFLLRIHSWDWGWNVGVLGEPWAGARVGITYRSAVDHSTEGTLDFNSDTSPLLGLTSGSATTNLPMPASTTGSITQTFGAFTVSADVQFNQWHTFKTITVVSPGNPNFVFNEGYRDSWLFSIGAQYHFNDKWTVRGGFGFDESPVVDAFRDTGVPDKDRYMISIGTTYQWAPGFAVDFGYAHYFAAGHATMNESVNAIEPITGAVFLNGRYDNHLDYVGISFRTTL